MAQAWLFEPIPQRDPPALPEGDAEAGQRGRPARGSPLRGEWKAYIAGGDGQAWVCPTADLLLLAVGDHGVLIRARVIGS